MKKIQLIEIGILAAAIISGYKFFDSIISAVISTLYRFAYNYGDTWTTVVQYFLLSGMYFAFFIALVKKRKIIAEFIDKQGESEGDGQLPVNVNQRNLLFVILISLCVVTLINEIPPIVIGIYYYFKREASGNQSGGYTLEDLNFKAAAIKLVFTVIVLGYARQISNWFDRPAEKDKPVVSSTNLAE